MSDSLQESILNTSKVESPANTILLDYLPKGILATLATDSPKKPPTWTRSHSPSIYCGIIVINIIYKTLFIPQHVQHTGVPRRPSYSSSDLQLYNLSFKSSGKPRNQPPKIREAQTASNIILLAHGSRLYLLKLKFVVHRNRNA